MARVRQRRDRPGPQCSVSCEVALGYNIRHLVNEHMSAAHGTLSRARLAALFSSQLNVSINRQPFCRLKNHTKYADLQDLRKGTMHFLNLARIKMALYMTLCQWILHVSRSAAGIECCCRQARGGLCLMIPWLLWAGDSGHIFGFSLSPSMIKLRLSYVSAAVEVSLTVHRIIPQSGCLLRKPKDK